MREYHALRVNLTPQDIDKLESNHKNLNTYIATLKDQLSEGRMAVATATLESHGEPVHPSISGTVTSYVKGVLNTMKKDTSLNKVEHPWTKKRAHGAYALAQAAAEEEAQVLASIASSRAGKARTAPKESRRKRRRRQNAESSKQQTDMLNSHDTTDGLPKTDLQQTFRDVHRNRSMLQDATVSFQPGKKSYSEPLVRPSTAPPPKSPYGALKLLQHVLTYDMYEYKRRAPREIGPGHYDLSAALPPPVKDPSRQSASFLGTHARGEEAARIGSGMHRVDEEDESTESSGFGGAPTTFSGRQKAIEKILKDQGIGLEVDSKNVKLSPYDRMTRGLRPPKRKSRKHNHGQQRSHPLSGSSSTPNLQTAITPQTSIGSNLWNDDFYNLPDSKNNQESKNKSNRLSPILKLAKDNGGSVPFDKQDLFYRPSSPEFRFPSTIRFKEAAEPHWKGIGMPYNSKKDLACWLQQKVYIGSPTLPRDGGADKMLERREEGPRNLDQSFNSLTKNLKSSPITYKSSFDKSISRFSKLKFGDDHDMPDPNNLKKWENYQGSLASDMSRPSLSFESDGHPEDTSVIITMGSQFDHQKPRFLPSTSLRHSLAALEEEINGGGSTIKGEDSIDSNSSTSSPGNGIRSRRTKTASNNRNRKSKRMSPTVNRTSPSSTSKRRPSSSAVVGASSLGALAQTV